jgi:AcrR family transcriptional regulator
METQKLTRRERQAELLKKEILEAAVKVFKEYGYEKATTKKIAKEADVSEGTLYYYFENKRDILITLFKSLIENIATNLVQVSSDKDNITNILSKGMAHQYEQINSLPIITLFLHEARLDSEVQAIFSKMMVFVRESAAKLLKQLEKSGKIKKVNHETMALLMSLVGIGYMTLFESGDSGLTHKPLKELTDDFAHILVSGLMPDK